jgi:hypothetical protein
MADAMKHDDQNKDAQSGRPVELEKEQGGKQGTDKQHQGGQQMPGREQQQGGKQPEPAGNR